MGQGTSPDETLFFDLWSRCSGAFNSSNPECWALKAHIWVLVTFGLVSWSVCNVDVQLKLFRLPLFFPHFPILSCFLSPHFFCARKYLEQNKHNVGIWGLNYTCLTTIPICFRNTWAEMLSRKASSRCQFAGKATLFTTLSAWGAYSVPLSEKWFSSFQLAFLLAWQQQSVYLFEIEIFSAWCTCILHHV